MPTLIEMGLLILSIWIGPWLHEGTHYLLGKLAGGKPFVSRWAKFHLFPREIDFEDVEALSPQQARIVGGTVLAFPFLVLISYTFAWLLQEPLLLFPFATFTTASGVSWFDLLASAGPEKWIRYTAGKPISRDDKTGD